VLVLEDVLAEVLAMFAVEGAVYVFDAQLLV
jgi:hypothetical protein